MALTAASVGQIDPAFTLVGQSGGPQDLKMVIGDFRLGDGTEYSAGITFASLLAILPTSIGISAILWAQIISVGRGGSLTAEATSNRFGLSVMTSHTTVKKVQWLGTTAAITEGGPAGTEYTTTAADVFRILLVGV